MVAACCNRATPAAGRAARAVLPDPHGRTPIQKVVGGFCLDSRYPNLVWLRQNSEPCDIPGRDTAPGFLLRLWCADFDMPNLVAKDHGTPRRLLRFCNVGSFPQNERRPAAGWRSAQSIRQLSPRKSCRYNGLVAFCRVSSALAEASRALGRPLGAVLMSPVSRRFVLTGAALTSASLLVPDRRAAGARAAQWRRRLRDHGLDPDRHQRAGHARPVSRRSGRGRTPRCRRSSPTSSTPIGSG
jgi:hypothetical protein